MKEKQIEEMAREMCHLSKECETCQICDERYHGDGEPCYFQCVAKEIIKHGYRKQSDGEWTRHSTSMMECSVCKRHTAWLLWKENDMARYIDAEALIAEYDRVHVGPAGGARKLMVEAPAADVVPRAEIRNALQTAFNEGKLEGGKEVAREIFEEIERDGKYALIFCEKHIDNDEIRQAKLECYKDIQNYVAELKKKYTEGGGE